MAVARNKSYSNRRTAASGFYQGTVTEVVTAEIDPFGIRVDIPRLGHKNAGPFPYVGPPPSLGDAVWVSFQESRPDELLVFNAGHQDGDDITEGVYRFGGQVEEWGVTVHIEPTAYTGSSRASLRFDKTLFGGGGSTAGVNGETTGDFFAYDFNSSGWLLYHMGAWGAFATGKENIANWNNPALHIYGGNKHGTPSGDFMRRFTIYPSYNADGTQYERLILQWNHQDANQTAPKDNGSSYYWLDIGQYGYFLGNFHPYPDDNRDLGWSSYRWDDIYATNSTIQTSDQEFKMDIADSALGLEFIKSLRPVSFKWKTTKGEPGVRTHHGLIGQEVEAALGGSAATTAMWTNSLIEGRLAEPAGLDEEGNEITPAMPAVEEHYRQGLRYSELIAPIIKSIQEINVQLEGNAFQSQSAVDYIADFDAKMLAKQPQADQDRADIADLKTRVAALEA